nr:helix-turn-helix domain-containing protein [Nakamurella flavida]
MPAVAARILIDEVATVTDASVTSDLLRDFLDLGEGHDQEVERRMTERGWRTTGYHLGYRVIGRTRLDTFALLRAVGTALSGLGVESHAAVQGRGITAWLRFVPAPSPRDLERHVHQLRAVHDSLRRSFNVAGGVGSLQADRAGLAATLGEAADAARIAAERSGNNWFVRVDGLGLEQLLLARTENDTFLPAARSLLAPLRGADAAGSRGEADVLLVTLTSYLDHESGIAATAQALGVHRNTVTGRVQRIQEILGVDMHDPGVRLALHLACRAVLR